MEELKLNYYFKNMDEFAFKEIFKNCTYANVNKNASIKRNNYGKS